MFLFSCALAPLVSAFFGRGNACTLIYTTDTASSPFVAAVLLEILESAPEGTDAFGSAAVAMVNTPCYAVVLKGCPKGVRDSLSSCSCLTSFSYIILLCFP